MNSLIAEGFVVGRPGLEPGTYGLKGRYSLPALLNDVAASAGKRCARSPRVNQ